MVEQTETVQRPINVGPEFHWQEGVYFARITELDHALSGGVRLRVDQGRNSPHSAAEHTRGHAASFEAFIPAAEWASIVAAVTPEGDNATTYRIATGLHG